MLSGLKNLFTQDTIKKFSTYKKKYGNGWVPYYLKTRQLPAYIHYNEWYDQVKPNADEIQKQKNHVFEYSPKISIVVPVYNPPIEFLQQMVNSVQSQTYSNWQLCIANASIENDEIKHTLKDFCANDQRISVKNLKDNLGISGNSNEAISLADGDYIALLDHDDILPQHALYEVVGALQNEKHDILYSDEDFISEDLKLKRDPQFKPDWSPHLLECHNYITHLFVVKKSLLDTVGYFNSEYDGAQDYDLFLRCTEATKDIYHIPKILYHWRAHSGSVAGDTESKMYAYDAGKAALKVHFKRKGIQARVEHAKLLGYYHPYYLVKDEPLVSIIIPNKDHVDDLSKCFNSLFQVNTYKNFEIIIVENNSKDNNTFKFYSQIQKDHDNIKIVTYKGEFNYSSINNYAVTYASGQYLLLLNNDTELLSTDGIHQMLGLCQQKNVGIVGAKLLYEDDTVQHAGIVIGFGGFAGHVYNGLSKDEPGYANKANLSYDCSAVTAACLMISKDIFNKVNCFNEDFKVAINDVDLCLRVNKLGCYTVCDNFVLWRHYESKSRGLDESSDNSTSRLDSEKTLFQKKWPDYLENGDPFYNSNFSFSACNYHVRKLTEVRYTIESAEIEQINSKEYDVCVKGWALTELNKKLEMRVFNMSSGYLISHKKVNRRDLFNRSISSSLNNLDGFVINTKINKRDVIKFIFTVENYTLEKSFGFRKLDKLSKNRIN